ncbi:ABC transporter substrate-binding protein [Burkholderia sp. SFA1]|uniref:ABC transporter substrate-binding protein n=1 Tax=unclassified Caballeronia TaxID=2646786 RepID=UPI001F35ECA5|nr:MULTISPECIES: ABC transporter substrate-binding protein [unclassified Caballeronia]MCE4544206.1 ABC transporter substrate-binding protein [Caballeronia sp. PC1]MCE4571357.1 ABC transporter substrate-binding protein [Caballeronia sp. CLC5]BBP98729.1 ABC transporter substrate-binding protein [Burkholderia sp. SFA1]
MTLSSSLLNAFAPTGTLRASINLGNPVLARRTDSAEPGGVSVDLARELASRLGVPVSFTSFERAAESVAAVTNEDADIGFFAIDPLRGAGIAFSAAYVLIEGCYLVRDASPVTRNEDVDREGNRIMVGTGSAYDLFLTREIKKAQIVRTALSEKVVDAFLRENIEVAAGVRQQLEADAARTSGLRLLDGRFMVIQQAMGMPKARGDEAARYLREFVEDVKRSGFVADALARYGIEGASVAPAAPV